MAIGGLILTLAETPSAQAALRQLLADDPRLDEGPRHGARMAVVAETASLSEGHALCETLLAHPGVLHLEVAYVTEEDEPSIARSAP